MRIPLLDRIMAKVSYRGGHWLWAGTFAKVPQIRSGGSGPIVSVRGALWVELFGPIPDGHQVYRTCEILLCIKPDHMRCGSKQEVQDHRARVNFKQCRHGLKRIGAVCPECAKEKTRAMKNQQRAAGLCAYGRCQLRPREPGAWYCERHHGAVLRYSRAWQLDETDAEREEVYEMGLEPVWPVRVAR